MDDWTGGYMGGEMNGWMTTLMDKDVTERMDNGQMNGRKDDWMKVNGKINV